MKQTFSSRSTNPREFLKKGGVTSTYNSPPLITFPPCIIAPHRHSQFPPHATEVPTDTSPTNCGHVSAGKKKLGMQEEALLAPWTRLVRQEGVMGETSELRVCWAMTHGILRWLSYFLFSDLFGKEWEGRCDGVVTSPAKLYSVIGMRS
jgi:hypothetical protein